MIYLFLLPPILAQRIPAYLCVPKNTHHEYNNDYLNSDKIANIYFTSDVDARNRVRDLNEYNKINLNEIRRENRPDHGVFSISQYSNHNVDNDVESNDSQVNLKDVGDNGDG